MYGKSYRFFDEKVRGTEEEAGEEEKKYSPSQSAEAFLLIFGAVIAVAWVMCYLPKIGRSHGVDSFLTLAV
jgi:hypothetical protein